MSLKLVYLALIATAKAVSVGRMLASDEHNYPVYGQYGYGYGESPSSLVESPTVVGESPIPLPDALSPSVPCVSNAIDLALILDHSQSIADTNDLGTEVDFATKVMSQAGQNPGTNGFLVTFAMDATLDIPPAPAADVAEAITPLTGAAYTAIGSAVVLAVDTFNAGTGLSDSNPNVALLVTDGDTTWGPEPCDASGIPVTDITGVEFFVIGVGPNFTKDYVTCLVKDESRILLVSEFSKL